MRVVERQVAICRDFRAVRVGQRLFQKVGAEAEQLHAPVGLGEQLHAANPHAAAVRAPLVAEAEQLQHARQLRVRVHIGVEQEQRRRRRERHDRAGEQRQQERARRGKYGLFAARVQKAVGCGGQKQAQRGEQQRMRGQPGARVILQRKRRVRPQPRGRAHEKQPRHQTGQRQTHARPGFPLGMQLLFLVRAGCFPMQRRGERGERSPEPGGRAILGGTGQRWMLARPGFPLGTRLLFLVRVGSFSVQRRGERGERSSEPGGRAILGGTGQRWMLARPGFPLGTRLLFLVRVGSFSVQRRGERGERSSEPGGRAILGGTGQRQTHARPRFPLGVQLLFLI